VRQTVGEANVMIFSGRSPQLRRPLAGLCALFLLSGFAAFACSAEIVFNAKVLGPVTNIYAVDISGEVRKVTDNIRWRDLDADIAANGDIVFSSNREKNPHIDLARRAENFDIYIVDPAGGEARQISRAPQQELMPRFSPQGKRIAYIERGGVRERLMLAVRDGGDSQALVEADEIFDFSWSPGGECLAVALRRGEETSLRLVFVSGRNERELVASTASNGARPAQIVSAQWSPQGEEIAFVRHPLDGPGRQLWVFGLANGDQKKISADDLEVQHPVSWSADGERLLYSALVNYRFYYDESAHKKIYRGAMHIFESDLRGAARQLTRGESLHKSPIYSRDQQRIAFLYADRLDARQLSLRTMNTDGGGLRELFDSVAQHSALRWQ
jgi:Tol biopolymer transport system component